MAQGKDLVGPHAGDEEASSSSSTRLSREGWEWVGRREGSWSGSAFWSDPGVSKGQEVESLQEVPRLKWCLPSWLKTGSSKAPLSFFKFSISGESWIAGIGWVTVLSNVFMVNSGLTSWLGLGKVHGPDWRWTASVFESLADPCKETPSDFVRQSSDAAADALVTRPYVHTRLHPAIEPIGHSWLWLLGTARRVFTGSSSNRRRTSDARVQIHIWSLFKMLFLITDL